MGNIIPVGNGNCCNDHCGNSDDLDLLEAKNESVGGLPEAYC